jgi:hypothetical protein
MSDKKEIRFFTLFFVLVLKTAVLSVFSTRKKTGEKKFYFFFIELMVIFVPVIGHAKSLSLPGLSGSKTNLTFARFCAQFNFRLWRRCWQMGETARSLNLGRPSF